MASTTKGSIKISTANEIGTALVDKLGGEGYAPETWSDNINHCGIAEVDTAPALSVLADSAGTGDEKGSILLATANKIGAMLNKKYHTARGFKPKEWASAISKTKALTEGTATGAIANIQNGAEKVALTSWEIAIGANLDGINEVVCNEGGANAWNEVWELGIWNSQGEKQANSNAIRSKDYIPVFSGAEYYIYCDYSVYTSGIIFRLLDENKAFVRTVVVSSSSTKKITMDSSVKYIVWCSATADGITTYSNNVSINYPSAITTYQPYTAPTTQAVELGRTIYGGTVDVVKGEGEDNAVHYELDENDAWSAYSGATHSFWHNVGTGEDRPIDQTKLTQCICNELTYSTTAPASAPDFSFMVQGGQRIVVTADSTIDTEAKFKTWLASHPLVFTCPASSTTPFTFPPLSPIPETEKIRNYWSEAGTSSVGYYEEPTPYTRGTATGAVANFDDARTDLPCTKVIANVAPSIAGKAVINMKRAGKNLYNAILEQDGSSRVILFENIYLPAGSYYLSLSTTTVANFYYRTSGGAWVNVGGYNKTQVPVTISESGNFDFSYYISTGVSAEAISNVMLEVGSSASAFEPYEAPTNYEATLDEALHGGSVDFVSGEVVKNYVKVVFDGTQANNSFGVTAMTGFAQVSYIPYITEGISNAIFVSDTFEQVARASEVSSAGKMWNSTVPRLFFSLPDTVTSGAEVNAYFANNPAIICYPVATPIESEIAGQVISPKSGVNNFWNDAGGDTEIEYFEEE